MNETLNLTLESVRFVPGENGQTIHLSFHGNDSSSHISGHVSATETEFFAASTSTNDIVDLVRTKLTNKLAVTPE